MSRRRRTPSTPELPRTNQAPEPHTNPKAHELDPEAHELDPEAHELDPEAHELDPEAPRENLEIFPDARDAETARAERAELSDQAPEAPSAPARPKAHPALTVVFTWEMAAHLARFFEDGGQEYASPALDRFAEMLRLSVQEQATCPAPTLFIAGPETPAEKRARLAPVPMPPPSDPPPHCPRRAPDCPAFEENGGRWCPRCCARV